MDKIFLEDVGGRMVINDVSMTVRNDIIALKKGELTYTNLSKDKSKNGL